MLRTYGTMKRDPQHLKRLQLLAVNDEDSNVVLLRELLDRLTLVAEYRDDDTRQHAWRIGRTCALLAQGLGLPKQQIELIKHAAPLHDIGKIGVPDAILLKPGKLFDPELELSMLHTTIGAEILAGSQSPLLQLAEQIALTHHERWDGRGYPQGLRGEHIPLPGRLVAVADVFDALTHERPYKEAWPVREALTEILSQAGEQFDPKVVAVFARLDHQMLVEPLSEWGPPAKPEPMARPRARVAAQV